MALDDTSKLALAAKVSISVVIYCLAVALVPIYNKKVFSGEVCWNGVCAEAFPYPISTAFLQLGFVAIVLALMSVAGHLCSLRRSDASWIFGPHVLYKLRHIAPVGVLFGFKYGITNWGLALVPTAKHLLLQSTDLVWTVIFARVLNKERLGVFEVMAITCSMAGAFFISWAAGGELEAPALGLTVNLLTPIFLALCITTLRTGAAELFRPDNVLGGSMSPIEFTAIKLAFSSTIALVLACLIENPVVLAAEESKHTEAWWVALANYRWESLIMLFCGGFLVLVFQVNITWLAGLTSAVTVGIVGEVKVLPQWIINAIFNAKAVDWSTQNVTGAILSLLGSILYAICATQSRKLVLSRKGFHWELRDEIEDKLIGDSTSQVEPTV